MRLIKKFNDYTKLSEKIKSYNDFLILEGINDIKVKWARDEKLIGALTKDGDKLLNRIINLDPTSNLEKDRIGKYVSWLIILFKRGDTFLKSVLSFDTQEDDYKIKEILDFFDKNKKMFDKKDINSYKTFEELQKKIDNFDEVASDVIQQSDKYKYFQDLIKQGSISYYYENNNWLVIIPNNKEVSCDIAGTKTKWCTARPTESEFGYYNKKGKLYIFLDKKNNLYPTYQLHIEDNMFMDKEDSKINSKDFFEKNLDIYNKLYPEVLSKIEKGEKLSKSDLKYLPTSYLKKYVDLILKDDTSLYNIVSKIGYGELDIEIITKDMLGFDFEYEIEYTRNSFTMKGKNVIKDFEDELGVEEDVINYIDARGASDYHDYDFFGDDDYYYMWNMLNTETQELLKKLKKILLYTKDITEENNLYEFLNKYKLEKIKDRYKESYIEMKADAVKEHAKEIMKDVPFYVNYDEITFDIPSIQNYLEANIALSGTLKEILEQSGVMNSFILEFETESYQYEDSDGLNNNMFDIVEDTLEKAESEGQFKYFLEISDKIISLGFNEHDNGTYSYRDDKVGILVKEIMFGDDFEEREETDSREELIDNVKLKIEYINREKNEKTKGKILLKNLYKYKQPMIF